MRDTGKILKVTLEYENEILIVDGEDAVAWKSMTDSMSGLAFSHSFNYKPLNWKIFFKKTTEIAEE